MGSKRTARCRRRVGMQHDRKMWHSMLRALFIGLPILVFLSAVPLTLKLVPPNRFYGYRTATTLSSLDAWYQVNFATGLAMIAAGIVGGIAVLLLDQGVIVLKLESRYIIGISITGLATLLFLIVVVVYADRF
jgi:SdpI/YfhL protein family